MRPFFYLREVDDGPFLACFFNPPAEGVGETVEGADPRVKLVRELGERRRLIGGPARNRRHRLRGGCRGPGGRLLRFSE